MRKIYLMGLTVALLSVLSPFQTRAQEYDVGVFYMPFWQNNTVPDPTNPQHNPWITIPYHLGKGGTQNHTLYTTFCEPGWNVSFNVQDVMGGSNWNMINEYDSYLLSSGISGSWDHYSQLLIPKPIWYFDNPDVDGFGFFDSPAYWYNENVKQVTEKQTQIMAQHNIDFVIYNWYWSYQEVDHCTQEQKWETYWEAGQKNWLDPNFNNHGVKLAIFWSNDFAKLIVETLDLDGSFSGGNPNTFEGFFGTQKGFDQMLDRMAEYMNMSGDKYKVKDGKNVLYINWEPLYALATLPGIENHAFFSGISGTTEAATNQRINRLLTQMNIRLNAKTGKEMYYVAVVTEGGSNDQEMFDEHGFQKKWKIEHPIAAGFDAITSYTYKLFESEDRYTNSTNNGPWEIYHNKDYNYSTMKDVYQKNYDYYLNTYGYKLASSNTKYQVPVTEGWNRAPFTMQQAGGMNGPANANGYAWEKSMLKTKTFDALKANQFKQAIWDNAISTPTLYDGALQTAKSYINQYPDKTDNTVILCCWNEHAEGTVIEPTFAWGYDYLNKVKNAFQTTTSGGGSGPGNGRGGPIPMVGSPVIPDSDFIPVTLSINQNFPNPFKDRTTLTYALPSAGQVQIQVYNTNNQLITTLVDDEKKAGVHEAIWEASGNKAGIYFFQIKHNGQVQTKKMILID